MDKYVYRWMILYGWMSFFARMNFIYDFNWINKSLNEIHPLLENKLIQIYLYPSSFVVEILISQIWMSFNNDG